MHQTAHAVPHTVNRQIRAAKNALVTAVELEVYFVGDFEVVKAGCKWRCDDLQPRKSELKVTLIQLWVWHGKCIIPAGLG